MNLARAKKSYVIPTSPYLISQNSVLDAVLVLMLRHATNVTLLLMRKNTVYLGSNVVPTLLRQGPPQLDCMVGCWTTCSCFGFLKLPALSR